MAIVTSSECLGRFLGWSNLLLAGTMALVICPRVIGRNIAYDLCLWVQPDHPLVYERTNTKRAVKKSSNKTTHEHFRKRFTSMDLLSTLANRTISLPTGLSTLTATPRLAPTGQEISSSLTNSVKQRQNGVVRVSAVLQLSLNYHKNTFSGEKRSSIYKKRARERNAPPLPQAPFPHWFIRR